MGSTSNLRPSERTRKPRGKETWRSDVFESVERLSSALEPDYVVIGGGGADKLDKLPANGRRGDNERAFVGGFRLWEPDWMSSPGGESTTR